MKNLFLGLVTTFALLAFTGCYDNSSTEVGATSAKSSKCGAGKCGDAKKNVKAAKCDSGKCGDAKKATKKAKCGTGKCGDAK